MKTVKTVVLLSALILSSCNALEMPNSLAAGALTPGIAPGNLSGHSSGSTFSTMNAQKGQRMAQFAEANTSGGTGWCYRHVAQAVHSVYDPFLWGEHAYMAADQLASSPHFVETTASLEKLPAGAVVVWEQGDSPSGHISIARGDGMEISDHVARQMTRHYGGGSPRVFLPQ